MRVSKHPIYECIECVDDGRVMRYGRVYSPYDCSGYSGIKVLLGRGNRKSLLVHRLVWEAFNGVIPRGMWVNHKNGDKGDNRLENLELVTPSQNLVHAYRELKCNRAKGECVHTALLTGEGIEAIGLLAKSGWSQHKIAKAFGVSQPTISNILNKKTWGHV